MRGVAVACASHTKEGYHATMIAPHNARMDEQAVMNAYDKWAMWRQVGVSKELKSMQAFRAGVEYGHGQAQAITGPSRGGMVATALVVGGIIGVLAGTRANGIRVR